jgi:hypothetical protein
VKKNCFGILLLFVFAGICLSSTCQAKTVVEKRLSAVKREYPNGSRLNGDIYVNGTSGGGCNALVMYATLKIFHNAYTPWCNTFNRVGKTASTRKTGAMKKLFSKAKVGDVIRWRRGYTDAHFAIFLSSNKNGIYIYESNYGAKNKVWYKHFWPWQYMKSWPAGGANKVNVYRSKNYNKVNQKAAAKNYKKGAIFVVKGIRYKVTKAEAISGEVKFVGYEDGYEGKKIPKYLYVNKDLDSSVNTNDESYGGGSKKKGRNAQIMYKVKV